MNVLQLISSRLGLYGAERVVLTLSTALDEMGIHNVVGSFLNTEGERHIEVLEEATSRGLMTEQIVCKGRLDWGAVRTLREIVQRHNIDVIHCHGIKPALYALLASHGRVGLVNTCHLWTFDSPQAWVISALERCLLHAFDHAVVVSDEMAPELRRFGVASRVIYNGVNTEPFSSSLPGAKRSVNWSTRPVVGAIGRLAPQKGFHDLLQAAPEVLAEHPNALFVFVGDGPGRSALEDTAKDLAIQNAVQFLGIRNDIPELLSSMDVVAMPSVSEGLPMALLEAMASARAVVASGVGAIPSVIQNQVNGIILKPGDVSGLALALRNLLRSRELRESLGRSARDTVAAHFSATSMAKQYLEIYRDTTFAVGRAVSLS